jgi:hypothetical protein
MDGAQQGIPFKAQPMVLVGYCVDCGDRRVTTLCRRLPLDARVGIGMPTYRYCWTPGRCGSSIPFVDQQP